MESVLIVGSGEDEGIGDEGISDEDKGMMGYEDKRGKRSEHLRRCLFFWSHHHRLVDPWWDHAAYTSVPIWAIEVWSSRLKAQ